MGHTVGKQAEQAVARSGKSTSIVLTPEQLIQFLRNNLRTNMFIPIHQTQALVSAYDAEKEFSHKLAVENVGLKALTASQSTIIVDLQAKLDEFRTVYEQENRTTTVQVARSEEGETKVLETVSVDGPVPPFLPEVVNASARGIA